MLLLEEGASIEAVNGGNDAPLQLAARNGHTGMVDLLVRRGAPFEAMDKVNYSYSTAIRGMEELYCYGAQTSRCNRTTSRLGQSAARLLQVDTCALCVITPRWTPWDQQ